MTLHRIDFDAVIHQFHFISSYCKEFWEGGIGAKLGGVQTWIYARDQAWICSADVCSTGH